MDLQNLIQIITPLSMILALFLNLINMMKFLRQPDAAKNILSIVMLLLILLFFQPILLFFSKFYLTIIYIAAGFSIVLYLLHHFKLADLHIDSDEENIVFHAIVIGFIINAVMNIIYFTTNWHMFGQYYQELKNYVAALAKMKVSFQTYQFMLKNPEPTLYLFLQIMSSIISVRLLYTLFRLPDYDREKLSNSQLFHIFLVVFIGTGAGLTIVQQLFEFF